MHNLNYHRIKIGFPCSFIILVFVLLTGTINIYPGIHGKTDVVWAGELEVSPASAVVEVGGQATFSVTGAKGEVKWDAREGWIVGKGTQVKYYAPDLPCVDLVSAQDDSGEYGIAKITVVSTKEHKALFSRENANWEVFTNRSLILPLLVSGQYLWVGTNGGLEKRKALTGEFLKNYTTNEGLPDNDIQCLLSDGSGGLWVGTHDGLGHYSPLEDSWKSYNKSASGLPWGEVISLANDGSGGVWIGTYGAGLAHLSSDGSWEIFDPGNSEFPDTVVWSLVADGAGGVWAGTNSGGLAHVRSDGSLEIFNTENSQMPANLVKELEPDGSRGLWMIVWDSVSDAHHFLHFHFNGSCEDLTPVLPSSHLSAIMADPRGVWIGTSDKGLLHLDSKGIVKVFNTENSALPTNYVEEIESVGSAGLWMITSDSNSNIDHLIHFSPNTLGGVVEQGKTFFPDNHVLSIIGDGSGGAWVGTFRSGLIHLRSDGSLDKFDVFNSDLPGNCVNSVVHDNSGGLWIGTSLGLCHFRSDQTWGIFNTENSGLPSDQVWSLLPDGSGGVWLTTELNLVHFRADHSWEVFDSSNSGLPSQNTPTCLLHDGTGGLWIGTLGGLAHFKSDGSWEVYDVDNSPLPSNYVTGLKSDGAGGIWIGLTHTVDNFFYVCCDKHSAYSGNNPPYIPDTWTGTGGLVHLWTGGLVHLRSDGSWRVYQQSESGLPDNDVFSILSDGRGGVWVGTEGGLAYLDVNNKWLVFDKSDSGLPGNHVGVLASDESNGVWVGWEGGPIDPSLFSSNNAGGLAHLTFGSIQSIEEGKYLTGHRAAILIAGGGDEETNTLWDTTEHISNVVYKMFNRRGFLNTDIYYVSPQSWADFNGDGRDDRIVDAPRPERPLTVEDIGKAFEWAKEKGKLNQPLYIFFIDHGGTDKLQLGHLEYLDAATLKQMLDDYQSATGNSVVLVIDACYSGAIMEKLAGQNRAIIASTGHGQAYFDRMEDQGFSRFLAKGLMKGMSFLEAFNYADRKQKEMIGKISDYASIIGGGSTDISQAPCFDDTGDGLYTPGKDGNFLKDVFINGSFVAAEITLTVDSLTPSQTVSASEGISLRARVGLAEGSVQRVWAVIRPPKMNLAFDSQGTPLLSLPRIALHPITEGGDIWGAQWTDTVYNGCYEITYYAEDSQGNIESSESSKVTVTGGLDCPEHAGIQVILNKGSYRPGDLLKVSIIENLSWGYDLYVAVILPDGQFVTLTNLNEVSKINRVIKWRGDRKQGRQIKVLEFIIPPGLPEGEYSIIGVMSPKDEDVLSSGSSWITELKNFQILNR